MTLAIGLYINTLANTLIIRKAFSEAQVLIVFGLILD